MSVVSGSRTREEVIREFDTQVQDIWRRFATEKMTTDERKSLLIELRAKTPALDEDTKTEIMRKHVPQLRSASLRRAYPST